MKKYALFFVFLFWQSTAWATLDLELTQGVDGALPVVVMPFGDAIEVSDVVRADLGHTGRIRVVAAGSNVSRQPVDIDHWKEQSVDYVLAGDSKKEGKTWRIHVRLVQVYGHRVLLERSWTTSEQGFRRVAHRISDAVYQQLTGERGFFNTRLAYVLVKENKQKNTRHYRLEMADADGKNPRTLLSSRQPIMSPRWSPDGQRLAYVSFEKGEAAIFIQTVRTGERERISGYPGINGAPAWSPDGKKLALVLSITGYPKLYIMDLETKKVRPLTTGWCIDTEPSWAPDAKSLVFTSNRGGGPQIYRYWFANEHIERVTFEGSYNASASLTPDGKKMVVLHGESGRFSIALQDLEEDKMTMLTTLRGKDESPYLAPNGSMVIYASREKGRGILGMVSTDGRVTLLLPAQDGDVQEPAWSGYL